MQDIFIHLGYPKTATTYLQRGLFRDFGFLGNDSAVEGARRLEHDLRSVICEDQAEVWRTSRGKEISQRISTLAGGTSDVYYSSEYWLRGPATFFPSNSGLQTPQHSTHMALEHLKAFQDNVWKEKGRVHVMVTFRRQSNWLGSQYAQISNRRREPGQADFEHMMTRFIKDEGPHGKSFLDYYLLYSELVKLFGKERVLFLPVEEVGTPMFWQRFETWSGLKVPPRQEQGSSRQNVRGTAKGRWQTRPRNPVSGTRAVVVADEVLRALHLPPKTKSWIKKIEKRVFATHEVTMTSEILAMIENAYAESNRALEKALDCPLSAHGYF